MEFKLNKIDTDIRKKMQEERKTDKVHASENISINKEFSNEKGKKHQPEKEMINQTKRFITIDGIKYNGKPIKIEAERTEEINVLNSSGRILDTKK